MRAITRKATFASIGLALAALLATGGASHATAAESPYSISARALLGPEGTDVYVRVTPAVDVLDKVQLKAWPLAPGPVQTRNFFDVPAPGGVATLRLDGIERSQRIEVSVHVKDGNQNNLETDAVVRLRPDLALVAMTVPDDVTRRHPFDVRVTVAETAGDVPASATVTLFDGATSLATQLVSIEAGGRSELVFATSLDRFGTHELRAQITGAEPSESDVSNNGAAVQRYVHRYLADGVVSADDAAATKIGVDILRAGGNAFDAAAAVFFALNVTVPHLAGIGGAANILVRRADGTTFAIDGRETASAATTPDLYKGRTMVQVRDNGYAVGVPGALRAVDEMLRLGKGTMTLAQTLQPAVGLARDGITVNAFLANDAANARMTSTTPELQAVFRPGGVPVARGQRLVQPDLAKTFQLIADQGEDAFYRGEIAQAIVAAQSWKTLPEGAGRMTLADLANYEVRVEDPLSIRYRGAEVLGAPPSTCGGLVVLEALALIDHFRNDPAHAGYPWTFGDPQTLHVMMEALRLAYADRNMWMGDDDFYAVPTAGLLSDAYLEERSKLIKPGVLVPGAPLPTIPGIAPPGNPFPQPHVDAVAEDESSPDAHTTHFSIVDQWGNAVAFTATVTDSFGSGILVPGYGFVLNDTNVNFNLDPAGNATTGNPGANDAGPGKRAMGNTAPTLVVRDGEPIVGTGSLGAKFIPSVVLQVVIDALDFAMPIQQAVDAPRFWGQNADGDFALNPGLAAAILPLRDLGHTAQWSKGNVARATSFPGVGSINSFAVGTDTITLSGGADATRHPDATATVVAR